ncbi:MAG TPA: cyclic nucleotide-binding domain-containing protein, partial [Galbitalea sp.]
MPEAAPEPPPLPADADPQLGPELRGRLSRYGASEPTTADEVLFHAGDVDPDFFFLESGTVDIVREGFHAEPEAITRYTAGSFMGELAILAHSEVYVTARVVEAGSVLRVPSQDFLRLMAVEGELSDVILTAFEARRQVLLTAASQTIEVVGRTGTAPSLALLSYLLRMELPHRWL